MLNRLYIVIGLLAILVLSGAFIVPRFVQWGDYRERMQALASEAVGVEVRISGDIAFTLLPQPRLKFGVVTIGPVTAPMMTVNDVEAELSLLDFLRDRYTVTRLQLNQPTLDVAIDAEGGLDFPMPGVPGGPSSRVSINDATIHDGQVRLTDRRSGSATAVDAVEGELRLAGGVQASFIGTGRVGEQGYAFRFSGNPGEGALDLGAFIRPVNDSFSMAIEGRVGSEPRLRFEGAATLRIAPPPLLALSGVQGPAVFSGKVNATTDLITFTDYTLTPDENRAGTRLTGAANLALGASPNFNAVISAGVFALPPRDATEDQSQLPLELVRLIDEIPAPFALGIPGRVGIDIADFNLRATSLRNLRVDATTDGASWRIDTFTAQLPGSTSLSLNGTLAADGRRAAFKGQAMVESGRLDVLAAQWRKQAPATPLVGVSASYRADLELRGNMLMLDRGRFVLGGKAHTVSAHVAAGENRQLLLAAAFDELSEIESAQIEALLPEPGGAMAVTFPEGQFSLTAGTATIAGLAGRGLAFEGDWGSDGITIARAQADMLGDAQFLVAGSLSGTVQQPVVVANGRIAVPMADAPALSRLFQAVSLPPVLAGHIRRSTPMELDFTLGRPDAQGAQPLHAEGRAGAAALALDASLSAGLANALAAPMRVKLSLASADPQALTEQFSLGPLALVGPDTPLRIAAELQGRPSDGLNGSVLITGGETSVAFDGALGFDGERLTGRGALNFTLDDLTPVAAWLGVERMELPGVTGRADVTFGADIRVRGVEADATGRGVTGEIDVTSEANGRQVTAVLNLAEVDLETLVESMAGRASLLWAEDMAWPDGPIDLGEAPPELSGRVEIATPLVVAGNRELLSNASFILGWSKGEMRLSEVAGTIGGGSASGELVLCCAGPLAEKQVKGHLSLAGVDLAAILDGSAATALSGTLTAGVRFQSSGASIAELAQGLAGDGSYTIDAIELSDLSPGVFSRLAASAGLDKAEPEQIASLVVGGLSGGTYKAVRLSGGFTLAGGTLRIPNLLLDDATTRLSGALGIDLADNALSGNFTLLPKVQVDAAGLVGPLTAPIQMRLGGRIDAPERELDLQALTDGIANKALEIELARLEELRLEEEARSRAAAEERARLMLWQKREQAVNDAPHTVRSVDAETRDGLLSLAEQVATERLARLAVPPPVAAPPAREGAPAPRLLDLSPLEFATPPLNRF